MLADVAALFEWLILGIDQAGLSRMTILRQARIFTGDEIVNPPRRRHLRRGHSHNIV